MRRVVRLDLSSESAQGLEREQAQADARRADRALNVEAEWRRARRNKPLREACDTLRVMAGNRERCMYCGDAHGSDIDHFWPKAPYPERMFRWPNMLLCCAECGRIKGTQFPLADGQAILIDPTVDDPWRFLDFDPQTGNIVPRYDPERGAYMLRGEQTVAILQFDRREAMARGYQRTYRRITRRVEEALAQQHPDAAALLHDLGEADDHGMLGWCFDGLGRHVAPFDELQARHPAVWELCRQGYRQF
jgi:uncharacterized protein (TIGR02646 family)